MIEVYEFNIFGISIGINLFEYKFKKTCIYGLLIWTIKTVLEPTCWELKLLHILVIDFCWSIQKPFVVHFDPKQKHLCFLGTSEDGLPTKALGISVLL